MKIIFKIAVTVILLTATVQAGRAAVKHYTFVDAIHEAMLFSGNRTEEELTDRVLDLADIHEVPLNPDTLVVRRLPYAIEVEAPYSEAIELVPGVFKRAWGFNASVRVRLLEDSRPRTPARR